MQGRVYIGEVSAVVVSVVQDFWELNCPADAVIALLSVRISQYSDVGDAAAEILPVIISRTTSGGAGSGGSVPTARPVHVGTPAFGGSIEANNTTQATTTTEILSDTFNIRSGWLYQPPEREIIWLSPSGILVVELPVAPADALTMQGTITFEVFGG